MPRTTYSEDEVAALFRRAAELQAERHRSPGADSGEVGLSLDELTAIAADAGLDPQLLRVAASELDHPGRKPRSVSRATSSEIVSERYVAGELDDDAREDIIAELRHRFDTSVAESLGLGSHTKITVQTIGRSMEWQHTNPWSGTQTRALIQPRTGNVRVRVARSNPYSGGATGWAPWYGPMFALIAGFIAAPAAGSYFVGIGVALLGLLLLTPLMIGLSRRASERHQREVEQLANDIAGHITLGPPSQAPQTAVPAGPPLMGTPAAESPDVIPASTRRSKDRS